MQPSSTLCRAQEAFHHERAAGALLENVRGVARDAAAAWGLEARTAERREARQLKTRAIAETLAARKQQAGDERSRQFSENPDRGFESP